ISDQLQQDNEAHHIHQISEKESQTKQQKMLYESLRQPILRLLQYYPHTRSLKKYPYLSPYPRPHTRVGNNLCTHAHTLWVFKYPYPLPAFLFTRVWGWVFQTAAAGMGMISHTGTKTRPGLPPGQQWGILDNAQKPRRAMPLVKLSRRVRDHDRTRGRSPRRIFC
ncbi:hypothetical protein A2U01_0010591, partial [Trifolium medium]|nr:hypothetical protein [Trifolium medium]